MKQIALTLWLSIIAICAYAQQITVTGTVTDADDNPLIGAAVVVVGTTDGVITDFDGKYSIKANANQSLKFTYVGYQEQVVKIGGRTAINVKLAEGEQLDEVVVIGYGTVKKSHLTGAVSSVSGKDLQANVARSASAALQGRVAGVSVSGTTGQPGEGMNINIRGVSSLSSTTPLYVIDGVYGDINMVDPADIQSIEVLKDASASAIYGSRAANGVVLITTKGGHLDTPTRVELNAYTGVQMVAKKLDVMDGNEFRDYCKATNYCSDPALLNWSGEGTDWQDALFRTAMISKVGLNVSGGNKTSTYNLSANYTNQDGIVKTTGYESWNIRAKNTFSLFNNHVRVGSTVLLKIWDKDYDDLSYSQLAIAVPQWDVYDDNASLGRWGFAPEWSKGGDNVVGWVEAHDNQRKGVDVMLNGYAEVDLFLKGLKYKFNVGIDKTTRRNYNQTLPYIFSGNSQNPKNKLSEGSSWDNQWMIENTLHYDNTFGKHVVSALLGYSAQRNEGRSFGLSRDDMPNGLFVINAGDPKKQSTSGSASANSLTSLFARAMYSFDDRYMASISIRRDGSSKFADGYKYGNFPSASIGWNVMNEDFFESAKKTINELKIRASYGVLGNLNCIGNYATQAVVTSGLNTVQGSSWWLGAITGYDWVSPANVTWEKTKTTNIGLDIAVLNNKLSLSADYFIQKTEGMLLNINQAPSFGMSGNPTMNAATVENRGLELALNHRNMVGELYYHVGLNATILKNKLKEITTPTKQEFEGFNPNGGGAITYAKVGKPIGSFYLIQTDGIFHSEEEIKAYVDKDGNMIQPDAKPGHVKYIDYDGDGDIDGNDRQYSGNPFPDLTLGLSMGAQYKGFDLNLFFDGNFGGKIYNALPWYAVKSEGVVNQFTKVMDTWSENNPNGKYPIPAMGADNDNQRIAYSDRYLENGSFFRLKTLEFGYTLPKRIVSIARLSNVRIYTAMENLFTITGYTGFTPDLGANGGDGATVGTGVMTRGCDAGRYPLARNITFGLQVNF